MLQYQINYRFALFICGIVTIFSLLLLRAVDLQVVKGKTYLDQAEENRFYSQTLPSRRGIILDRYHDPLVLNTQKYFQITDPKALYETRTPISRETALQMLTSTQSAMVVTDTERLYRYPFSLAHVVGYVGDVTAEDLQRERSLQVGQHIGKTGLELTHEKEMQGTEGKVVFEIDALAHKQREIQRTEPIPGKDILTSLDPYLTEQASKELVGIKGTVVISDTETGKIKNVLLIALLLSNLHNT